MPQATGKPKLPMTKAVVPHVAKKVVQENKQASHANLNTQLAREFKQLFDLFRQLQREHTLLKQVMQSKAMGQTRQDSPDVKRFMAMYADPDKYVNEAAFRGMPDTQCYPSDVQFVKTEVIMTVNANGGCGLKFTSDPLYPLVTYDEIFTDGTKVIIDSSRKADLVSRFSAARVIAFCAKIEPMDSQPTGRIMHQNIYDMGIDNTVGGVDGVGLAGISSRPKYDNVLARSVSCWIAHPGNALILSSYQYLTANVARPTTALYGGRLLWNSCTPGQKYVVTSYMIVEGLVKNNTMSFVPPCTASDGDAIVRRICATPWRRKYELINTVLTASTSVVKK